MTRRTAWALVFLLAFLFAATAYVMLKTRIEQGKGMPAYSVYSEEPTGYAKTAEVIRYLGWTPEPVTQSIQQVRWPDETPCLLFIMEPQGGGLFASAFNKNEVEALLRWVERGNTLVLASKQWTPLHEKLDISIKGGTDGENFEEVESKLLAVVPADVGGYTRDVERLGVSSSTALERSGDAGLPLWWIEDEPGALLYRKGQGRILILADPDMLAWQGLGQQDNVMFLNNLVRLHARDGRVYFDEFHHGLRSGGGFWAYLRFHNQQWVLLPLLVVLGISVWAAAVRLGPAVSPPSASQADAVDYASALARIYQQAGVRHLLGQSMARGFTSALTRHLRLRRQALPVEIASAWRKKYPDDARSLNHLNELLKGISSLRQDQAPERHLLGWSKAFDQFLAQHNIR